jgi:hypothetical protein
MFNPITAHSTTGSSVTDVASTSDGGSDGTREKRSTGSSANTNNSDSCSDSDGTAKGKSAKSNNMSSGSESGESGVSPNNSDSTSSGSQQISARKLKKEDEQKQHKSTTSRRGKNPTTNQCVSVFPRKKKTEEYRAKDQMIISLKNLEPLFNVPLKEAATKLGISTTALKSVCRKFGLKRWPYMLLKQVGSNDECLALMLQNQAKRGV